MARLEVEKKLRPGLSSYIFKSTGINAHADFNSSTGVAEIRFIKALNLVSALEAVLDRLLYDAKITCPRDSVIININPRGFSKKLAEITPRFGFTHTDKAFHGEFTIS